VVSKLISFFITLYFVLLISALPNRILPINLSGVVCNIVVCLRSHRID